MNNWGAPIFNVPKKHQVIERTYIGKGTVIWNFVNIFDCKIGKNCLISSFVEIQRDVVIGDYCKIMPFVFIPTGVTLEDEVFVGPHVCFINCLYPRAVDPDWMLVPTLVKKGASVGAGSIILGGVTIGENAVVGAGSIVTKDVPRDTLVYGCPAGIIKKVK